jgi:hypothetical protein
VQARYLTAGFGIADDLGSAVAGLGWLGLLDAPPAPDSANTGLMTYALARKPAFAAMKNAPSERARPVVGVATTIARAALRSTGLEVFVTPRVGGPLVVELRRGGALKLRVRGTGRAGSRKTLRLRGADLPAGRYAVTVSAPRAATVRRGVRVR